MHRNARLTPEGHRILCERIASGRPAAHVAAEMGCLRTRPTRWWSRYVTAARQLCGQSRQLGVTSYTEAEDAASERQR